MEKDEDKKIRAKRIVAKAKKWAEEKRKEGWTREDFAKGLKEMLESDDGSGGIK